MSPFFFDLVVVVLVLLSAGLGFLRGFCNEVFTIFGWIGAVLATILLTPVSRAFMRTQISNKIIADLTTASLIFIVTMIVFSIISHYATKSLQASKLNAVDRSLGFAFGLLRGVLLLGLMFLLVAWIWTPDTRPAAIKDAKTRPLLEASAHMVQFILPGDATVDVDGDDAKGDKSDDALNSVMQPRASDKPLTDFQKPVRPDDDNADRAAQSEPMAEPMADPVADPLADTPPKPAPPQKAP